MKRTALLAALLCAGLAAQAAAAEITEIPFAPLDPAVMGRGESLVADATGWDSFFYNPAGFSRQNGSFTLADTTSWIYARPDELMTLGQAALAATPSAADLLSFMSAQVTGGGIGAGMSAGIGYVGNGLGLGAMFVVDSLLSGPSLLGLSGDATATLGFVGGLSFPFELGGITIHLGGAVRPMVRLHVPLGGADALALLSAVAGGTDILSALSGAPALYGVGIGLDLGTIVELGWFDLGVSVRDLGGTQFRYAGSTFGAATSALGAEFKFPAGSTVTDTYTIPMDIRVGMAFHPDLGTLSGVIDPSVSVDLDNVVGAVTGAASVWSLLHAGVNVKLLSLFTVSAGLDQGYVTAGAGLKLLFLDINAAVFTRELGAHLGDKPNSGVTLDVALRW
jgi:hypothetical protein